MLHFEHYICTVKFPFQTLLLKRLLLAYGIYTACRVAFVIFNFNTFSHQDFSTLLKTFYYGLLFDTSAIIYTNAIFIFLHLIPLPFRHKNFYQIFLKIYFITINSVAVLLNLSDTGYYPFSGKRSGLEILNIKQDIFNHWLSYVTDYWHLTLLLAGAVWGINKLYNLTGKSEKQPVHYFTESFILIVSSALCFLGARGGWNLKPLNTFDAARLVKPEMVSATINTPFQMLMTVQQIGVQRVSFMSDEEAESLVNPVQIISNKTAKKKNIVLLIVESMGKEYVGYYNNGKGYTPFIDSLISVSTSFENAYANGKRSITALPSILASMPSLMADAYTNSYYQSNKLQSIGGYLQGIGYQSLFFHGAKNGSMSFDNFIGISNGGKYFGLNEYPDEKDFDGHWGVYDEPYLQYVCRQISQTDTPFFATAFTLSSHHPYSIPDDKKHLFKGGTLPIHQSVEYTDYSLRQFFETAKKQAWYDNTIFIITADHSAENETHTYANMEGMHRVPLFMFEPQNPQGKTISNTTQHLDILPLVLNKIGYSGKYFSFGRNPLDTTQQGFAVQFPNDIYQIAEYPWVLQLSNGEAFQLLNVEADTQPNLIDKEKEKAEALSKKLKAFIQIYNTRLIENRTSVD